MAHFARKIDCPECMKTFSVTLDGKMPRHTVWTGSEWDVCCGVEEVNSKIIVWKSCPQCDGTRHDPSSGYESCTICNGTGEVQG